MTPDEVWRWYSFGMLVFGVSLGCLLTNITWLIREGRKRP